MFQSGDIVDINNEEYVIVSIISCNKITYLYLATVNKPTKVLLAKQLDDNGSIQPINSKEEMEYVLSRFDSTN